MKKVYGYIRVSTVKQGTGVSLQEQRDAIIRYAEKHQLKIINWFEEQETAAKQGRPLFNKMMRLLKKGKVDGVVIHKIDRSARNLKDWAAIGDLIDQGIDVHFAHESLDLNARGGRLAADIQAVIASDYIRNLRDEAVKGLYGRLKQGIYPFGAPIGYQNNGSGQLKTIDPIQGPLVKKAFELYVSGKYNLKELTRTMNKLGLRNTWGNEVSVSSMSKILSNPFYTGIIKIKGKSFSGGHEPLVPLPLYKKANSRMSSKSHTKHFKHDFLFRRMIKCAQCGYSLTGERQKGHIYYRCHTKGCSSTTLREDRIDQQLKAAMLPLQITLVEQSILKDLLIENKERWMKTHQQFEDALNLQKAQLEKKAERLTDAYIDEVIDKYTFQRRKEKLLQERRNIEHRARNQQVSREMIFRKVENFFELVGSLMRAYRTGIVEEKRRILRLATSNLSLQGKRLVISMKLPFAALAEQRTLQFGPLDRDILRTCTAHFADMATSGDNYLDCTKIKAQMKELYDVIIEIFAKQEEEKAKVKYYYD